MKLHYTPHIGFCSKPFCVDVTTHEQAVRTGILLVLYQTFLGMNNHSQSPEAKISLQHDDGRNHIDSIFLIKDVNEHKYFDLSSLQELAECDDAMNWKLRLQWYPQIPCQPFVFPVQNLKEARAFYYLLADYDRYLLEECTDMRVDYANMGDLLMYEPLILSENETSQDEVPDPWTGWYYEGEYEYVDDFSQYLAMVEENIVPAALA